MTDYTFRPMTLADMPIFHAIYGAESIEIYGSFSMTIDELISDFTHPGYNIETDSMAAFTADGEIVAWADVNDYRTPPVRPYLYGYVHVDHRGKGLGTQLVQWGIERCKQVFERVPEDARVVAQAFSAIDSGKTLLENNDFMTSRQVYIMQIDMVEPPPKPQFPTGFHVETMADGVPLRDIAKVSRDAFRDHRGYVEHPLEEDVERWQHRIESQGNAYDPELFMLVKEGDTPAGAIMAWTTSEDDDNKARVISLGVVPDYRRRGLATQLLYTMFNAVYERGKKSVSLSVDSSSLTGAHIVYEKAGMYIAQIYNAYELELRSGVEISNQGLRRKNT